MEDVLLAADKAGFEAEELNGRVFREEKVDENNGRGVGQASAKIGTTVWFVFALKADVNINICLDLFIKCVGFFRTFVGACKYD